MLIEKLRVSQFSETFGISENEKKRLKTNILFALEKAIKICLSLKTAPPFEKGDSLQ